MAKSTNSKASTRAPLAKAVKAQLSGQFTAEERELIPMATEYAGTKAREAKAGARLIKKLHEVKATLDDLKADGRLYAIVFPALAEGAINGRDDLFPTAKSRDAAFKALNAPSTEGMDDATKTLRSDVRRLVDGYLSSIRRGLLNLIQREEQGEDAGKKGASKRKRNELEKISDLMQEIVKIVRDTDPKKLGSLDAVGFIKAMRQPGGMITAALKNQHTA